MRKLSFPELRDLAKLFSRFHYVNKDPDFWRSRVLVHLHSKTKNDIFLEIEHDDNLVEYIYNSLETIDEQVDLSLDIFIEAIDEIWGAKYTTFIHVAEYWYRLQLAIFLQEAELEDKQLIDGFNTAIPRNHNHKTITSGQAVLEELIRELWIAQKRFEDHQPLVRFIDCFRDSLPGIDLWQANVEKYTTLEFPDGKVSEERNDNLQSTKQYILQVVIYPSGLGKQLNNFQKDTYTFETFLVEKSSTAPFDESPKYLSVCEEISNKPRAFSLLSKTLGEILDSEDLVGIDEFSKVELFLPIENMLNPVDQLEVYEFKLSVNYSMCIRPYERLSGEYATPFFRKLWKNRWKNLINSELFNFEILQKYVIDAKKWKAEVNLKQDVSCYGIVTNVVRNEHINCIGILIKTGIPVILWIHENGIDEVYSAERRLKELQDRFRQSGMLTDNEYKNILRMKNFRKLHHVIDNIRKDLNQVEENNSLAECVALMYDDPYLIPPKFNRQKRMRRRYER